MESAVVLIVEVALAEQRPIRTCTMDITAWWPSWREKRWPEPDEVCWHPVLFLAYALHRVTPFFKTWAARSSDALSQVYR
jgi:hypothetical protein